MSTQRAALQVLKVLRKIANGGVTVVAAIHSPTSYAFQLFDDLIILIRGRVVYAGANGMLTHPFYQRPSTSFS